MKESTKTKKALRGSLFALFLCIVLLIGTTFAWFTDTASTGVNRIQAGNLDVGLQYKDANGDWQNAEGKTLDFKTADNRAADEILWEPGCTYELPELRVVNNGNLALKFHLTVNGVQGDDKLLEALEWTMSAYDGMLTFPDLESEVTKLKPGNSWECKLSAHMKEEAGNDYQGLSLGGVGITVVATQDTVESDSFNDQYDKDATYPLTFNVSDTESLNKALASVTTAGNTNVDIKLTDTEKTLTGVSGVNTKAGTNLSADFNNNVIEIGGSVGSSSTETNGAQFLKGSNVTLKNGTYKFTANNQYKKILIQNYANLNLENVTLDASDVSYALSTNCGKVTIKGKTNINVKSGGTALDVMHWENASYKKEGTHVVFEESMTGTVDGKIDVYCYRGSSVIKPVDDGGATLVIKGGTFKNSRLTLDEFKAFVPSGYTVTTNADGSYTVSK